MRRTLILILTIAVLGCNSQTSNGYEVSNGEFDALIKNQKVKTLVFLSQYNLIEIELKPSALEGFRDEIDKLKTKGKINNDVEFRLYLKIINIDRIEDRVREIEIENGLSAIVIQRK